MSSSAPQKPQFAAERLPRYKRSELVVAQVKRWIVERTMRPGDYLPNERELVSILNTSRGTVREALKALEYQGLIETIPGAKGGTRVASMSREHASQLLRGFFYFKNLSWSNVYDLRFCFEPNIARDAVDSLTADQVALLQATIDACRAPATNAEEVRKQRFNELQFHNILAEACGNPMLNFMGRFINDLLEDFSELKDVITPQTEQFRECNLKAHMAILDALKRKDKISSEQLMREHINEAGCFLTEREKAVANGLLL